MKTVLITGAAGGMGSAAVKKLTEEGYEVYGLDRRAPDVERPGFRFIETDLTDSGSVREAFQALDAEGVRLDAVIHMSGIYDLGSLVEMDEADFIRIFDINLTADYRVNKIFLPMLKDGGRIILISSELAPLDPLPFTGIYGITKAAVEKYAFSLRMELQLLGHPVVVIRPGAVDTGLLDVSVQRLDRFVSQTGLYTTNAERFKKIVERVEARKVPPEKVAAVVSRSLRAGKPRYVYKVNRNPLLLILNALPDRLQCRIIRALLRTKR